MRVGKSVFWIGIIIEREAGGERLKKFQSKHGVARW